MIDNNEKLLNIKVYTFYLIHGIIRTKKYIFT